MSAIADSTLADPKDRLIADLQRQLAERTAERDEALEQQTATAEVLQVINASPGDLKPVFDALLERALAICGGTYGGLLTFDGERFHPVASRGHAEFDAWAREYGPVRPAAGSQIARIVAGEDAVQLTDIANDDVYRKGVPPRRALVEIGGFQTLLCVALRRDNTLLGVLQMYRQEARPFSNKQIALLQNFAAQAVIAMENARLINETREALEQQTATAEVLQVINSSPGDLASVFDAMLEKALHLCEADFGTFWTYDGDAFEAVALRGAPGEHADFLRGQRHNPGPGTIHASLLAGEALVHIPDLADTEAYRAGEAMRRRSVDVAGAHTVVAVPLRKGDRLLGLINIYRRVVRPFSERQTALLENFAAQTVIAMENARLLTETREALEQQTATAEVLQVINSSPGNLAPVFEAMLEKAMRLCGAAFGLLSTYDGGQFHTKAMHGVPEKYAKKHVHNPPHPGPRTGLGRIERGEDVIQITDLAEDEAYRSGDPRRRDVVDLGGARSYVAVALRKDGVLLGTIAVYRQEVRPFSDKQIALLQNFAAQAVIAMENARLITETREALEQQTATAEVLQVINSSPGDLAPVFEAILEKAHVLCGATHGALGTYDGDYYFRTIVTRGYSEPVVNRLREGFDGLTNPVTRPLIDGAPIVHIADLAEIDHPIPQAVARLGGFHTGLFLPLRKDGRLLGHISATRSEVRPFAEKEIALLENFAAQAVIAMENARLITETREALEQQTATAEVLQVINSSPGNLAPVFEAILERAHTICGAELGSLVTYDGGRFQSVATHNYPPEYTALVRQPFGGEAGSAYGRLADGERYIHIPDLVAVTPPGLDNPIRRAAIDLAGIRTVLLVPLRKENAFLGYVSAQRREVRPFSDKEIALIENFAAQAVIAIENARLLTETREALEQQTATAEVLQVINSSPGDLAPVFDAMLEKAHSLCGVTYGSLQLYNDGKFRAVATRGYPRPLEELLRQPYTLEPDNRLWALLDGARFVETPHVPQPGIQVGNPRRRMTLDLGIRNILFLPLRKGDRLLGFISAARQEAKQFSEKEITLLESFAAQAVIAMENARLINETREALEQQTATAEVLQVINSSPGDLGPVFDTMVERAARLCEADEAALRIFDGELLHLAAVYGSESDIVARLRQLGPTSAFGLYEPFAHGERIAHYPDVRETAVFRDHPVVRERLELRGIRTWLAVALQKEGVLLGVILVHRHTVRPFSDKQIALLQNFAAQAVIAMENARLLTETREALDQQTATAEVLQVINSSPGELTPVFDAMLEKAIRLCDAAFGVLQTFDGHALHVVALHHVPERFVEYITRAPIVPDPERSLLGKCIYERRTINVADNAAEEPYRARAPLAVAAVELGRTRSMLHVPLFKDETVVGIFTIFRQEVRPFTEKQAGLLQNFAAQAVIAIENARLLNEIRQRQAELRATFENMGDGVAMFGADLRLAAWNRNFQQIIDLPEAVLAERLTYADYLRILAERGEFGTEGIEAELNQRIRDTGKELRLERTRPDGRIIEVRRNAVPGGGFVLIYSDITERKRAETEIRAARDTAEKALGELRAAQASLIQSEKMASLGQLTAGIAHEIKNPLNFVNNFAGLSIELLDELKESAAPGIATLDDDTRADVDETIGMLTSNLDKIAEHGKRADNIVKSMLEHSRGVSGERRAVDLNALIDEALNLAYHGARAQDQSFNITLERDFQPGLAPIEVVPQEITRVFLNLFSNGFYAATKRQREGNDPQFKPTLKVTTRAADNVIKITVRDSGTGIPPEIRDRLFQPFFTTKPTGEGTGLGLSISYDIITQQHGGTIEVDSEPGAYTEFTIRLPRQQLLATVGRVA